MATSYAFAAMIPWADRHRKVTPRIAAFTRLPAEGGIGSKCVKTPIKLPAQTKGQGLFHPTNHSLYCRTCLQHGFRPAVSAKGLSKRKSSGTVWFADIGRHKIGQFRSIGLEDAKFNPNASYWDVLQPA